LVRHREGPAQTQGGRGGGGRAGDRRYEGGIDRAYRLAERLGIPLWGLGEAGPYRALPQPGAARQPVGCPARFPHESVRGAAAKLLTLFRPATGAVRACPVASAPTAVLSPG
jgi:hypothetical protein